MKLSALFSIHIALFTSAVCAQETQFEKLLKKNETYKSIVTKFDAQVGPVNANQDITKLNSAIDKYIAEKESEKKAGIELIDAAVVDQSDCPTCPSYLNLSDDISKVLGKIKKGDDIPMANQIGLGLNNLKFLYYTVKYELPDGQVNCRKFGKIEQTGMKFDGSLAIKSEELIDIPNLESIQYIPEGGSEVIYLYRGSGAQRNTLVEVQMLPEGKAVIRYFTYSPSAAELLLEKELKGHSAAVGLIKKIKGVNEAAPEPESSSYIDIAPSLKLRDGVVPTDLNLVKAKGTAEIAEGLNLQTKTAISFNQQTAEVALTAGEGKDWVKVNAVNNTLGTKEIVTVIPMKVTLDEGAKLNLNGNIKNETIIAPKATDNSKSELKATSSQTISMSLTDHNSKFIELELYQRPSDKYSKMSASSELKSDALGTVTAKFSTDSAGDKAFSLGKVTDMGGYGKLTTEFGSTQGSAGANKSFVAVQHEVELSKASSFAVTAKTSSDRQVTTMFQFKSKF